MRLAQSQAISTSAAGSRNSSHRLRLRAGPPPPSPTANDGVQFWGRLRPAWPYPCLWRSCGRPLVVLCNNLTTANVAIARHSANPWQLLLDCRPKPTERGAQLLVANIGKRPGNARRCLFIKRRQWPPFPPYQRRLVQPNFSNCPPAEEAIDPLENDGREVLNFERARPFHPQYQRPRLRLAAVAPARPANPLGLGMFGNVGPRNFRPACHKLRRCKALFGKGGVQSLVQKRGKRLRLRFARLVHAIVRG